MVKDLNLWVSWSIRNDWADLIYLCGRVSLGEILIHCFDSWALGFGHTHDAILFSLAQNSTCFHFDVTPFCSTLLLL